MRIIDSMGLLDGDAYCEAMKNMCNVLNETIGTEFEPIREIHGGYRSTVEDLAYKLGVRFFENGEIVF